MVFTHQSLPLTQELLLIIMGSRHLTSSPLADTACVSTSRGQVYRSETPWGRTMFTGSTSDMRSYGRLHHLSSISPLDCAPIGRPDVWRWVAGIRACIRPVKQVCNQINSSGLRLSTSCSILFMDKRRPPVLSSQTSCKDIPCT